MISICLRLWCRSPDAYNGLRYDESKKTGVLILPSTRLLAYYKNFAPQHPGVIQENLEWMRCEAQRQGVPSAGMRGDLCIDEMSVQDDVQILRSGKKWKLVGFVDVGKTANQLEKIVNKSASMATHALQYVFSGFTGFRWPVAYYTPHTAQAYQIYYTFIELLEALINHGFRVDYLSMDGASTNCSFMKILFRADPRDDNYLARSVFCQQQKIAIIQDIKHCLKKIRNSLEASKEENIESGRYLLLENRTIVWELWEGSFAYNTKHGISLHCV